MKAELIIAPEAQRDVKNKIINDIIAANNYHQVITCKIKIRRCSEWSIT
jgi:hypothetical protein